MAERPIIGVPTQTLEEIPGELPRCWVMSQQYVRVLVAAGAVPWIVPLIQGDLPTLRGIYERLDGVFLPGGVDLDPSAYHESNDRCGRTDPARDEIELTLTRWALEDRKPLLAVCRGIQVVNVAAGGSVHQDLASQLPGAIKHDYFPGVSGQYSRDLLVHDVELVQGSRLSALLEGTRVRVNSMHHQGIKRLGAGLRPSAHAPDGLIEGIESPNGHFLVGVQWHPEALAERDQRMNRLFTAFIQAASAT
jgi:putative glutamine amidotransferase